MRDSVGPLAALWNRTIGHLVDRYFVTDADIERLRAGGVGPNRESESPEMRAFRAMCGAEADKLDAQLNEMNRAAAGWQHPKDCRCTECFWESGHDGAASRTFP